MIFVSVGTQEFQFKRLLDEVLNLKNENKINDCLIIQSGANNYLRDIINSDEIEVIDFLNEKDFLNTLKESRIFITHGGTGSIIAASKCAKKTIVVPRLAKFKEHVDDHQLEITNAFYEKNIIEICLDINSLYDSLQKIETKSYSTYENNNFELINDLMGFIQK